MQIRNFSPYLWVVVFLSMEMGCASPAKETTQRLQDSLYKEDSLLAMYVMDRLKVKVKDTLIGDSIRLRDTFRNKWEYPLLSPESRKKIIPKDTTLCEETPATTQMPVKKDSVPAAGLLPKKTLTKPTTLATTKPAPPKISAPITKSTTAPTIPQPAEKSAVKPAEPIAPKPTEPAPKPIEPPNPEPPKADPSQDKN